MDEILGQIHLPEDIRKLNLENKRQLAKEIREEIIEVVSKNGGHLASNLGIVEITIGLHSIFGTPTDKIVWDVGHQTYVHKILTGRKEEFKTLRTWKGLAGFPKTEESEYDCFDTGHSSTSISVALGMARARDLKKQNHHVIAVIGDGALTGGMALEALNDAGCSRTNLIVILNDNQMSISKNVGGISQFLTKVRTRKFYQKSNNGIRRFLEKIPKMGPFSIKIARKIKNGVKRLIIPNMLFEDLGFTYLGPVDGNDIEKVEWVLDLAKKQEGPVLVHMLTKKGKGYLPAEERPDRFHATGSFDKKTGEPLQKKKKDYATVFGETLEVLAKQDTNIVAVTAAMAEGTGLKNFSKNFPERFFDVGIAEQHAIAMAAGLARAGLKPVVPIYSSFYQRAYDQVIHDVCIQKLPVVMCVDRAGIVGQDGETHQGIFDLSFFKIVPNLVIMAPKDFTELEKMLSFSLKQKGPAIIRYPRGGEEKNFNSCEKIELGKAEMLQQGKDVTILAIGKMVARAMEVAKLLQEEGTDVEVINIRFLKPLDREKIINSIRKTKHVVTIEDNVKEGGLASSIKDVICEEKLQTIVQCFGYPDKFIKHGKVEELEKEYGLDIVSIKEAISKEIEKRKKNRKWIQSYAKMQKINYYSLK